MDSRMQAVMNFVREGSRVADIGADHGYLSIELVKSGRASKVIATEKNIHPFEATVANICAAGFSGKIEARHGDGLQILRAGEVDTICIAGMGGALITQILDDAPQVVQVARTLILQPMNGAKKIRSWLAEKDWFIVDEDLAESAGIIYEIICAEKIFAPRIFKRETSPLLERFLAQRLDKLQKVRSEMQKSLTARQSDKFAEIQAEIAALQSMEENIPHAVDGSN